MFFASVDRPLLVSPNSTLTLCHLCAKIEDCTNSVSFVLIMIIQSSAITRLYAMYSV